MSRRLDRPGILAFTLAMTSEELAALRARVEGQEQLLEWLGVTLAVVGIGFGALITLTVIFFALRTEESAVAAARREVESSRHQIDKHVAEAEAAAKRAEGAVRQIEQDRLRVSRTTEEVESSAGRVREIVAKIESHQASGLSREEVNILHAAASELREKPTEELSSEDFSILLAEAREARDWDRVLQLARTFEERGGSDANVANARNYKSVALYYLGKPKEATKELERLVAQFQHPDEIALREQILRAHYNLAAAQDEGEDGPAVHHYDLAVNGYVEGMSLMARASAALAAINRGNIRTRASQFDEALADYDRALEIVSDISDQMLNEPYLKALVNKQMTLATLGRHAEALAVGDRLAVAGDRAHNEELKNILRQGRILRAMSEKNA